MNRARAAPPRHRPRTKRPIEAPLDLVARRPSARRISRRRVRRDGSSAPLFLRTTELAQKTAALVTSVNRAQRQPQASCCRPCHHSWHPPATSLSTGSHVTETSEAMRPTASSLGLAEPVRRSNRRDVSATFLDPAVVASACSRTARRRPPRLPVSRLSRLACRPAVRAARESRHGRARPPESRVRTRDAPAAARRETRLASRIGVRRALAQAYGARSNCARCSFRPPFGSYRDRHARGEPRTLRVVQVAEPRPARRFPAEAARLERARVDACRALLKFPSASCALFCDPMRSACALSSLSRRDERSEPCALRRSLPRPPRQSKASAADPTMAICRIRRDAMKLRSLVKPCAFVGRRSHRACVPCCKAPASCDQAPQGPCSPRSADCSSLA